MVARLPFNSLPEEVYKRVINQANSSSALFTVHEVGEGEWGVIAYFEFRLKIGFVLFNTKNLTFSKSKLKQLIDDLSEVDMQLADPVKPQFLSNIFGESGAHKRRRKEIGKALIAKKCMLINTFTLPNEPEELLAFVNLAFSCYQSADHDHVKSAWKGKLNLATNRLRTLINSEGADHIADEFLFLSEQITATMEKGEKKKGWLF